MHKIVILSLGILSFPGVRGQMTINHPDFGLVSGRTDMLIHKIVLTDTSTDLYMSAAYQTGMIWDIPGETYITPVDNDDNNNDHRKYYVKSARDIGIGHQNRVPDSIPYCRKVFMLSFPPMPPGTGVIDLGQDIAYGEAITDIRLTKNPLLDELPDGLFGEWYDTANGDLQFGFYKRAVVYDQQLWHYKNVAFKNGKGSILISNGKQTANLQIDPVNYLTYRIGVDKAGKGVYARFRDADNCHLSHSMPAYRPPLMKMDSVTYAGYISDYNTRTGKNTLTIVADDLLAGVKHSYIVKIRDDGYFSTRIPLYCPESLQMIHSERTDYVNVDYVYVEPGKKLFTIINGRQIIYAGSAARLANELRSLPYPAPTRGVQMPKSDSLVSPQEYKAFWLGQEGLEQAILDSVYKTGAISDRAYQIRKKDIIYSYSNKLMDYGHPAPLSYFDFIDDRMANDALAMISDDYDRFIYRLRGLTCRDSLGLKKGLVTDVLSSQHFLDGIVNELIPLKPTQLAAAKSTIGDPFIAAYVAHCNREVIGRISANAHLQGSFVRQTPAVAEEQLFDSIVSRYKGKVIYLDCWATWCAPCLAGIQQIAPLKEEMKDKGVVFVYITDNSSPLETWQHMIPSIKGEHYRLTNREWGYLSKKFHITGIPHTILVDKAGNVVNPDLGMLENDKIKSLLTIKMKD